MCATCVPGALEGKKSIGSPGTKVYMVMNHHVGAGNTRSSVRTSVVLFLVLVLFF